MMSLTYILKEMAIGAISCLLVVSMVGVSFMHQPVIERADAGAAAVAVIGGIGTVQETFTAVATAGMRLKEFVLDPMAWIVADMVIQRMTRDIVSWINSGFQGEPAFMRDFGGFLTDIADQAVGDFLASDETLRFLCSPFRLNIRYALSLQYSKSRNYGSPNSSCTLTGAAANLDRFLQGDMVTGGWDQWFKVTQDPQYNPYGSLLLAQEQLSVRLTNTKAQQTTQLTWGDGFLSSQDCQTVENRRVCRTITPGTTIEEALNDALGNPSKRIAVADEISEIMTALFSQLVTQAFDGLGGLLGLTGGGGSGSTGSTYFNDVLNDTSNSGASSATTIEDALRTETTFRNLTQSIVNNILDASTYKDDTYGSGNSCHSGNLTPDLQSYLTRSQTELATSIATVNTLTALLARFNAAIGQPNQIDLQNQVLREFTQLQSQGRIHYEPDIQTVQQLYIPQVNDLINDLENDIDAACSSGTNDNGVNTL
jgi:hypothetical protein